ncbi:MAG TPA: hypothetical protein VGP61_07250 [Gemmatimonadales bacterium]|nr:hypothetical protein [Gemmatimonadales bacterium]
MPDKKLGKAAKRAAAQGIPASTGAPELVAAWETPAKAPGELREALLYTVAGTAAPEGRPCALRIATQPGLVFKLVLSGEGNVEREYWSVAYWPGFVLALGGRSTEAYEAGFAILRSVAAR